MSETCPYLEEPDFAACRQARPFQGPRNEPARRRGDLAMPQPHCCHPRMGAKTEVAGRVKGGRSHRRADATALLPICSQLKGQDGQSPLPVTPVTGF